MRAVTPGGPGVAAAGNSRVVTHGHIAGGLGADGATRAHAVDFTGGGNTLVLENGYSFTGLVVSDGAGDTLTLGGDSPGTGDGSFDLAQIGAGAEFQGFGTFTKTGTSTWTLQNTNASTQWSLGAGTLAVDGVVGGVDVAGGTLAGTGSAGAITLGAAGAIAPGGSPGTLNGASLTWNGGGSFDFELGSTPATSDLLALTGGLDRGSGSGFRFHFSTPAGPPQGGVSYTLIRFARQSGFQVGDFSYDSGSGTLKGHFVLTPTDLQFVADAATPSIPAVDERVLLLLAALLGTVGVGWLRHLARA